MLSLVTTASSTSSPSMRMVAARVNWLTVRPNSGISAKPIRMATGMPAATHSAARQGKNSSSTRNTMAMPARPFCVRALSMAVVMRDSSLTTTMCTPGGRRCPICATRSRTRSTTAISLASDERRTPR